MRIALMINGLTGYLSAQYRALHARGHELLLVTPGAPEVAVGAMADTAFGDLGGSDFAEVHAWTEQPDPAELVRLVARFDPDAVIMTAWNFSDAYRAVMKAVAPRVVRVMIMDNLWRAAPRQWLGRGTHRWYVDPVADAALVPSDRTEFYARRLGFGPDDIIRGSLSADTGLFASPPREGAELAGRRAFLTVGRLVDHKGPQVLAPAYQRYRAAVDDPWDLHLVGIGPMADLFEGAPGVVRHGFADPAAVAALMRETSCLVLPSLIEPYGVVLHEAAASALPIITSDFAGAAAAFVQDGQNGWQVPAGDIGALAAAMTRLAALPHDRLTGMSRVSHALGQRLSPEGWALHLEEELQRRIAAGGGRLSRPVSWREGLWPPVRG